MFRFKTIIVFVGCFCHFIILGHVFEHNHGSIVSMMGNSYSILVRYAEFAVKTNAFDESELTNAVLAYYLEVINRVSRKPLSVAG